MTTDTILDDFERQNPRTWRDIFRKRAPATALQLASASLEECRRDQLEHAQRSEYHAAILKMLKERDQRLQKDIQRLTKTPAGRPQAGTGDEP